MAQATEGLSPYGKLVAFARDLLRRGWDRGLDQADVEELALEYGLLETVEVTEPCSEHACTCAELVAFPTECHQLAPWLKDGEPTREKLLEGRVRGAYSVLMARGPASLDKATEMLGDLLPPDERADIDAGMRQAAQTFGFPRRT